MKVFFILSFREWDCLVNCNWKNKLVFSDFVILFFRSSEWLSEKSFLVEEI